MVSIAERSTLTMRSCTGTIADTDVVESEHVGLPVADPRGIADMRERPTAPPAETEATRERTGAALGTEAMRATAVTRATEATEVRHADSAAARTEAMLDTARRHLAPVASAEAVARSRTDSAAARTVEADTPAAATAVVVAIAAADTAAVDTGKMYAA